MTRQLKLSGLYNDNSSQYKTEGLLKLFGLKNMELLLSEASGYFGNDDKSLVNEFDYALIGQFKKAKIFFLDAAASKDATFTSEAYVIKRMACSISGENDLC
ncbi:hypothetical protein BCV72DRAFT_339885 [Rhizopus microsporus var. microsporus]|uniref:Uncharacterized protein n=2 Tax=Rhizopus microsporus TaxID=58291 RepID=A0A2G4SGL2_RHIZD|nr:uncharacterized protein RHIMIDRAFT_295473 [Rhizopus microsporus ATCC 52813]ORE00725.1 hypothetical protein BCV72DRAFT_339885 [Rhizopus microsporus var. microsporus]PHZ07907.1 hypothetical protein RHIMIDRAFT_295473 [Rhizopus microsporus ATCC 52813]